jgi:hypothetical protein
MSGCFRNKSFLFFNHPQYLKTTSHQSQGCQLCPSERDLGLWSGWVLAEFLILVIALKRFLIWNITNWNMSLILLEQNEPNGEINNQDLYESSDDGYTDHIRKSRNMEQQKKRLCSLSSKKFYLLDDDNNRLYYCWKSQQPMKNMIKKDKHATNCYKRLAQKNNKMQRSVYS